MLVLRTQILGTHALGTHALGTHTMGTLTLGTHTMGTLTLGSLTRWFELVGRLGCLIEFVKLLLGLLQQFLSHHLLIILRRVLHSFLTVVDCHVFQLSRGRVRVLTCGQIRILRKLRFGIFVTHLELALGLIGLVLGGVIQNLILISIGVV